MTKIKRIILTIITLIGLIITGELINIYHKVNFVENFAPSFCSVNSFINCDGVAQTPYSMFLGVPLAIWGLILYLIIFFLIYVDKINEKFDIKLFKVFKNPVKYIAAIGLFSFAVSMILASISFFKIHMICTLCLTTYVLNFFIALTAKGKGFFADEFKTTFKDFVAGVKEYLILFIAVAVCAAGLLIWLQTSMILSPNLKLQKSFEYYQKLKKNIYAAKGNTLGNPDGNITIYLYSDFMCPFCKVTNIMMHRLAKEQKDVVVYHMNFPLDSKCNPMLKQPVHTGSCILSMYALAAANQGAYWDMVSAIYDDMPNDEIELLALAGKMGLDKDKLAKDAYSKENIETLKKQIQRAIDLGLKGTPTIVIDGIEHRSALPYYKLEELVKQARARHKRNKD